MPPRATGRLDVPVILGLSTVFSSLFISTMSMRRPEGQR